MRYLLEIRDVVFDLSPPSQHYCIAWRNAFRCGTFRKWTNTDQFIPDIPRPVDESSGLEICSTTFAYLSQICNVWRGIREETTFESISIADRTNGTCVGTKC